MKETKRVYMIDDSETKQQLVDRVFSSIPHTKALGVELVSIERNMAIGKLPYQKNFVGNIENGAIHTGVLISLIDSMAGLAVFSALPEMEEFATLDLRLDSFKPSTPGQDIYASAECYRLTKAVAFVRGSIYHNTTEDLIAGCVATFFRTGRRANIRENAEQWV